MVAVRKELNAFITPSREIFQGAANHGNPVKSQIAIINCRIMLAIV